MTLPADLRFDPSEPINGDISYVNIDISPLQFNSSYKFQFQWIFQDPKLNELVGNTFSNIYNYKSPSENAPLKPAAPTLYWNNGFLGISWNGQSSVVGMPLLGYKQVNIWIKGPGFGDGNTYTKTAHFFTSSGFKSIPLGPGVYYVKLQAETILGTLSEFSDEVSTVSYKPPKPVSGVNAEWIIDTLKISFTFDTTEADSDTNSNAYASYFKIILTNKTGTIVSRIFYSPVNKSSSAQLFYLTPELNKSNFGLFATQFDLTIQVVDSFGNVSTVVPQTSLTYVTPLSVPVITVDKRILGYTVSYISPAANLPFDQIYIYESTDGGTTYNQVAQGKTNPIIVNTTNTTPRKVKAKFFDSNGLSTAESSPPQDVTPDSAFSADTQAPVPPTAGLTATSGIDTTGTLGFNGFINLSWTAVADASLRGYRIRFRPQTTPASSYSYVDAPGTGATYRISGLAVGSTTTPIVYEIGIASYDEFNNTSVDGSQQPLYTSFANQSIGGTPAITDYITAGNFQFGQGVDPTNTTGVGGIKRGLFFDSSNYWLLNASNSARLKVGGATSNYLLWDGSDFVIDGDLRARKGNFSGNVTIAPGGSLMSFATPPTVNNITGVAYTATTATYTATSHGYVAGDRIFVSGTAPDSFNGYFTVLASPAPTPNNFSVSNTTNVAPTKQTGTVIKASGTGFVLSKDGIKFNSSTATDVTTIDAATGKLSTSSATIGGWDVTDSQIKKNGIELNSSGTIIANNAAYYVGIKPQVSTASDIVLWAGQSANGSTANFKVEAGGTLRATGAVISGTFTVTGGNAATTDQLNLKANTSDVNTLLDAKLNDSSNFIKNAIKQVTSINGNGIAITAGSGYTINADGVVTYTTGGYLILNSNGIVGGVAAAGVANDKFTINASTGAAVFKGTLTAPDGDIGGWSIGADALSKGTVSLSSSGTNGQLVVGSTNGNYIKISSDGIQVGNTTFGNANFRVNTAGDVTANSYTLSAGTGAGADFIKSDGTFKLAGGKIDYGVTAADTLTIKDTKFVLGIESDENGTMGDTTVVQSNTSKQLTTGRALFYGGTVDPNTPTLITSRAQHNGGSQGSTEFVKGDLWLQRA